MNPYLIDEPAVISFSGGRTSAYMLYKVLEAHGGKLPDHVVVAFSNTGKEMPQTLDFVDRCSKEWDVPIVWLEFIKEKKPRIVVDYESASRKGEPFHNLISQKKFIPNDRIRACTEQLKVVPINKYMESLGHDPFLTVVGIRADEQRRVAKQRAKENYALPLADAGVTLQTSMHFGRSIRSSWTCLCLRMARARCLTVTCVSLRAYQGSCLSSGNSRTWRTGGSNKRKGSVTYSADNIRLTKNSRSWRLIKVSCLISKTRSRCLAFVVIRGSYTEVKV